LNQTEALRVMQRPTWGDMSYAMAAELITAKINVASGNATPCVQEIIRMADDWMRENPVGTKIELDSDLWKGEGHQIFEQLYDYNRSKPCPAIVL
jgi:hypothetical protein